MIWDFNKIIREYKRIYKELKEYNYDWGTLILGIRRVGKSTFSQYISYLLHQAYRDKKPNVYLFLGAVQDIAKVIQENFIEHSIIIFDELGVLAFSRDFMKKEQRNLIKALNVASAYNNFYLGTIQDIQWMDKNLRNLNFWKDAWLIFKRGGSLWYAPPVSLRKSERMKSLVNLFFNWGIFAYYYYFLNPKTVRSFIRIFPAWAIYYDIPKSFWNHKFLKLWNPNKERFIEISPKEYREVYRRDLSIILGSESELYKKVVKDARWLYNYLLEKVSEYGGIKRVKIQILRKIRFYEEAPDYEVEVNFIFKKRTEDGKLKEVVSIVREDKLTDITHPKFLEHLLEFLNKKNYILLSKEDKSYTVKEKGQSKRLTTHVTVYDVLLLKEK